MSLTKTPICNYGEKAIDFSLTSTENKLISLNNIIGEKGSLEWENNISKPTSSRYSQTVNSKVTLQLLSKPSSIVYNNVIRVNEMYINEIRNFLDSITSKKKPLVDGLDGLNTLRIGLAAIESAKKNRINSL